MKKKVYLIGERPELILYGDIEPVFAAAELLPVIDNQVEPVIDAIRIFFFGGAAAEHFPFEIPPSSKTVFENDDVRITSDGINRYGQWYGRALSVLNPEKKTAVIVLPGLRALNTDFISRYIFRPILDELLYDSGYMLLHAAGVASHGEGCIITGPAGSGKTSVVSGLIDKGFEFIADDRIVLKKDDDDRVCMYAFPEYIRRVVTARGPKRLVLPPVSNTKRAVVKHIVLLHGEETEDETTLRAISAAESSARLIRLVSVEPETGQHSRLFEFITDMCDDAESCLLSGRGDVDAWVSEVAGKIRGIKDKG